MRNLFILLQLILCCALFGVDKKLCEEFSHRISVSSGVLLDFPSDIRHCRQGPVEQSVVFEAKDRMRIRLQFSYKNREWGLKDAVHEELISLFDLKNGSVPYVLNEHVNAITFACPLGKCSLGFSCLQDARAAKNLLDKIVSQAKETHILSDMCLSEIARRQGYTYLVVAPRGEHITEALEALIYNPKSQQHMMWLTRRGLDQIEQIAEEACCASPLCLYDLSLLDRAAFFTTPRVGAVEPWYIRVDGICLQSVFSYDSTQFEDYCLKSQYVGIRFITTPSFDSPSTIFCSKEQQWYFSRAIEENTVHIDKKNLCITKRPQYISPVPRGTTFLWISGLQEQSYEMLQYCFEKSVFTPQLFSEILYREFPYLRSFLQTKSIYAVGLSREEALCYAVHMLREKKDSLTPDMYRAMQIALFSCELGAPFGEVGQIGYNSLPLALALAEKCGCTRTQKHLVRYIVEDCASCLSSSSIPPISYSELFYAAADMRMSVGDLLSIRNTYVSIIAAIRGCKIPFHSIDERGVKTFFGVVTGRSDRLEGKDLCSVYLWELRDPLHRDGLLLAKKRAKYEALVLKDPTVSKNGFWKWLEKTPPLAPTVYLTKEQKKMYYAEFDQGVLCAPKQYVGQANIDLIFVVDGDGNIVVGEKVDANGPGQSNFNHASFCSGQPVICAGKFRIENGKIIEINDHSGHYRPTGADLLNVVAILEAKGVSTSAVAIDLLSSKKRYASGEVFKEAILMKS